MPLATLKTVSPRPTTTTTQTQKPRINHPEPVSHATDGNKEIFKLPLSRLKIHPFNSRAVRTQERIDEVKDMLEAEHKQREPITVVPGRQPEDVGFYYILSGQTRFHAANLAGWSELDAQINAEIDPDNHLVFWAASIEHNTSRPETDWDLAIKVKALMDEGATSEQIQKAARKDSRGLRRLLAMTDLPEPVQAVIREAPHKLSSAFCEALRSGIEDLGTDEVAIFAKAVVDEDLSRRALEDRIERAIRRKAKAVNGGAKRATRQFMVPIIVGSERTGEFKVMQSRNEGNRLVSLNADLPENLVETFKTDIEAAIVKLLGKA